MHPFSRDDARSLPLAGVPVSYSPVIPLYKDASTAGTIAQMTRIARACAVLPDFLELGREAIAKGGPSPEGICEWVRRATQGYFTFQTDDKTLPQTGFPDDSQLLLTPDLVLAHPGIVGACGSYSTFCATILLASRLPIDLYFTTIAADNTDPSEFSHVYLTVVLPSGNELPIDSSHGKVAGWESLVAYRKHQWLVFKGTHFSSIEGDREMNSYNNLQHVRGLGDLGDIDWNSLIQGVAGAGEKIAINDTAPQTVYSAKGADGSTVNYSIPQSASSLGLNLNTTGISSTLGGISPIVLIGLVGLLVFAMSRGGK